MRRLALTLVIVVVAAALLAAMCGDARIEQASPPHHVDSAVAERQDVRADRIERRRVAAPPTESAPETGPPKPVDAANDPAWRSWDGALPPRELPLEVRLFDAESDAPVDATLVGRGELKGAPVRWGVGIWRVPVRVVDGRVRGNFEVAVPEGYVPGRLLLSEEISPMAQRVLARLPVRQEARILVRVVDPTGAPVPDAAVESRGFTDENGELRVRGVAYARGRSVTLQASKGGAAGPEERLVLGEVGEHHEVVISVPEAGDEDDMVIKDAAVSDHNETDPDLEHEERLLAVQTPTVVVTRRNGSPAASVLIRVERQAADGTWALVARRPADARGRARLSIPTRATRLRLTAHAIGFVPTTIEVELPRADPETVLRINEQAGLSVTVRVVDEDGRPVRSAFVEPHSTHGRLYTLEGDEQQLRYFTDANGEVFLAGIPDAPLRVNAVYGGRRATGRFEPGEEVLLRLGSER